MTTTKPTGRDWVGLVTWNMHTRGTHNLTPHRDRIDLQLRLGVTVLLLQEAFGQVPNMLHGLGLLTYKAKGPHESPAGMPQTLVAWDPSRHHRVWSRTLPLNRTAWGTKGGRPDVVTFLALVALRDLVTGDEVVFGSYHTAPRVQVPEGIRPWRRFRSLVESARVWRRVARAHSFVIMAGDDNVDEDVERGGPWGFLRRRATGLRIIAPKAGTLDGSPRRIDGFRVKGRWQNTEAEAVPVPESDHHVVRVWVRRRR